MIPVSDSLSALSRRERGLVGLLVAGALPLAVVFLVLLPLVETRQAASQRLAEAREFVLRAWWVVTFPGLAILVTVLALNLLGDGLRDASKALGRATVADHSPGLRLAVVSFLAEQPGHGTHPAQGRRGQSNQC